MQFSQQLIARIQQHFKEKHHKEISAEQANASLNALADLYLLVVGGGCGAPQGAADHTAPLS